MNLLAVAPYILHGYTQNKKYIAALKFVCKSIALLRSNLDWNSNYSIYEIENCYNAESIWKFPHFTLSKKKVSVETICGNTVLRYVMTKLWNIARENAKFSGYRHSLGCYWTG